MIHYRTFTNFDPPGLVGTWNEALTGRGAVHLPTPSALEEYIFAKPYFDPAGLILALDDDLPVGFAHAGFGPDPSGKRVSTATGVVCMVAVRPAYRRRGIGSELLRRCEAYLTGRGARAIHAGPKRPLNPFYFGLYGGSDSAGFLASDESAAPFLGRHGYAPVASSLVFQRTLDSPVNVPDARFLAARRRFDVVAAPRRGAADWWQECTLGPIELLDVQLVEKGTNRPAARVSAWEMLGYGQRWDRPAIGMIDLEVREDLRRQGLARFLLVSLLRHVQEQYFSVVEVQVGEGNEPALNLFRGLGFVQVDSGRMYRKV